ncbi:MAG: hypothetical protein SVO96_10600 [Pseudomonadota bacterium]|nr:hypothetical protein [Pseudomonadota bacterium]
MHSFDSHFALRWIQRTSAWIWQARLAFFTALIVALALFVSLLYWQTEPSVRLSGLLLQLLGITSAAIGIRDTRRMFGKPSFLAQVRTWLNVMPIPWRRTTSVSTSGSDTSSVSDEFTVQGWHNPDNNFDSRLSAAERNLQLLHELINNVKSDFDAHVRDLSQRIRNESETRKENDRQLHLRIESASTDGLHLAAAGVVWLACGIVMSTAPNELLNLIR